MKSLSASIIVLSGVGCLAIGVFRRHGDTEIFVGGLGLCIIAIGLLGWFVSFFRNDPPAPPSP
jgi:hypothetical protein